jgi:hypothetical protein
MKDCRPDESAQRDRGTCFFVVLHPELSLKLQARSCSKLKAQGSRLYLRQVGIVGSAPDIAGLSRRSAIASITS